MLHSCVQKIYVLKIFLDWKKKVFALFTYIFI